MITKLPLAYLKVFVFSILLLIGAFASVAQAEKQSQPDKVDFLVTADFKEEDHPYFLDGGEIGFLVDGVQGPALTLERGKTYVFEIDTGVQHDFYLSTKALGWGTATLTKGVKGNYTYKGWVTFSPDENTPDTVYYSCRNHKYMGGAIHIADAK
jgi:hypothetical protein